MVERAAGMDRYMVAIAGPPGAGKSTFAERLVNLFPPDEAAVVPMDGFHYDNVVLDQIGLRGRKGAPETFDFGGFVTLLRRIRRREADVAIPVFDREADLARAGAAIVGKQVKFIIAEGNYLLLDEEPWTELSHCFDLTVFLDVQRAELHRRLLRRWLDLDYASERAEHWIASNDMPNIDRVLTRRRPADLTLSQA
jgi:pantothenate kinase